MMAYIQELIEGIGRTSFLIDWHCFAEAEAAKKTQRTGSRHGLGPYQKALGD